MPPYYHAQIIYVIDQVDCTPEQPRPLSYRQAEIKQAEIKKSVVRISIASVDDVNNLHWQAKRHTKPLNLELEEDVNNLHR